ncbi:hypothetical protein RRG08_018069 [Elysia crispata]|uniref:SSD domain-containing protein n=1 Tax=Elysia crispata TaxID=231223 RepID=A0AAE0ZD15_9GAST|nr:hypothetical protein RRG08_018069 [Elysia crispata]
MIIRIVPQNVAEVRYLLPLSSLGDCFIFFRMGVITRKIEKLQRFLLGTFYNYGYFLACHPIWFLVVPMIVCAALSVGILTLNPEVDSEALYAPMNSRAIQDRDVMEENFPDQSGYNYYPFSKNRLTPEMDVIFRSREPMTIFNADVLAELKTLCDDVRSITVSDKGQVYTYTDLCAKTDGDCYLDGGFLLTSSFQYALALGNVTYPRWRPVDQPIDLRRSVGGVTVAAGILKSANAIMLRFPLRSDTPEMRRLSLKLELEYLLFMENVNRSKVEVAFSASRSIEDEVDKSTAGDTMLMALTFAMMITYASLASTGGDCVSTRALLANAGVLATVLGIFAAFGFISAIGVRFVNIVSVMPFLALGIGVDDVFLLMSGWSETLSMPDLSVPERIGTVFKKAGIGITITSVTDFLAFLIGSTSVFLSVKNFCIYTGVAVLFCFICNASIFGACLTLHGRRVFSRRHTLTCLPVRKSRESLQAEGGVCFAMACGGQIPTAPSQDQSICEKGPQSILKKVILLMPVRMLVLLLFAVYLGVAIWGCIKLQQGLDLKNIVLTSSYLYKYFTWLEQDFGSWLIVSFVSVGGREYSSADALQNMQDLLSTAHQHASVDPEIGSCWLTSLAETAFYNTSSDSAFILGLHKFLENQTQFHNDVVFDSKSQTVLASRCHVFTEKLVTSNDEANLMTAAREIADASPADLFAYAPLFVLIEQYVIILTSTLKTVGFTVAVMLVVTIVFLPQPVIVGLVMFQVIMILVGVFGFMAHWDLTLSSVTMIHLIMSVGFSVDFCAHVCTAYMVSDETTRHARALDAIVHASGPILNGSFSSMLGVLVLSFTESYIFKAFFKVMLLVIGFGAAHAILLVPVMLSFIGPNARMTLERTDNHNIELASHSLSFSVEASTASKRKVTPVL